MKLKYYLRGLGIGIVVTALLMGYSNKNHAAEQIVQEQTQESAGDLLADRIGEEISTESEEVSESEMAENTFTEEVTSEPESETETTMVQTEETSDTESETVQTAVIEDISVESESQKSEESSETESVEQTASTQPVNITGAVEITIARGDDSGTVARKLQNAGLVENASEYDAYLMQHGYDKKIRVGSVTIPADSTWQEIAEYISGRR